MGSWQQHIDRVAARSLHLPAEQLQRLPRLTWIGQSQLYIEHYEQMLNFSEQSLRLQTTFGDLTISGMQLRISGIHEDEILVEGKIISVSYGATI
jgi:sporulation protein YqfC